MKFYVYLHEVKSSFRTPLLLKEPTEKLGSTTLVSMICMNKLLEFVTWLERLEIFFCHAVNQSLIETMTARCCLARTTVNDHRAQLDHSTAALINHVANFICDFM